MDQQESRHACLLKGVELSWLLNVHVSVASLRVITSSTQRTKLARAPYVSAVEAPRALMIV